MSYRFAHYRYQQPSYNYSCFGFLYYSSIDTEWFIMDDFGNAVVSNVTYAGE